MTGGASVVGLGKLGACMAACIASKGIEVFGVDTNPRTVAYFNEGRAPVMEPGLAELIEANRGRLSATSNYGTAIAHSNVTFVVVPTPSDEQARFSIDYVVEAASAIGHALRRKTSYHLVVITSTVLPGSTGQGVLPVLEQASGKRCGLDFGLCYNPEFIALGNVIHDLLNPDFILIGESDTRAGATLEKWYESFCDNSSPVCRMNFVNAELTKISVNTFVTTKITFANTLAAICEELPGADVDIVTDALGMDSRIGRRYLTGGLGYGGPCFPRDNQALAYLARQVGCPAGLAETTDQENRAFLDRQIERIKADLGPGKTLAIIGLAYKPDTNVVEGSQSLMIARSLASSGIPVIVFDPIAIDNARDVLLDSVEYAHSLPECLERAHAVVIANPCREFRKLKAVDFPQRDEKITVFDCWRLLRDDLSNCEWIKYVPLGLGKPERERRVLEPTAREYGTPLSFSGASASHSLSFTRH
jgi:UDPglucose 6-dehydrogenase